MSETRALLPNGSEAEALRALVTESLRRVIPHYPSALIIEDALDHAGLDAMPTEQTPFCAFVSGALYNAVSRAAGDAVASGAMGELDWIMKCWTEHRSSGTWNGAKPTVIPHLTIVAVDDEPEVVRSVARVLRQAVWTVHTATSGEDGLRLCLAHMPDVVLTDINMPVVSGNQFATLISLFLGTRAPPIIALTGETGLMIGHNHFSAVLHKPVHEHHLLHAINRVVAETSLRCQTP